MIISREYDKTMIYLRDPCVFGIPFFLEMKISPPDCKCQKLLVYLWNVCFDHTSNYSVIKPTASFDL